MSKEENNNKLPLINIDKRSLSTKSETFTKSQNNILSYKSNKSNLDSTLKNMALKRTLMNTSNEISKFKLRSTSTNINNNNTNKPSKRDFLHNKITLNSLSSLQRITTMRKNYRSFNKKLIGSSKSKSKSNNNTVDNKNNNDIVDESNELKKYYYRLIKFGNDITTIKRCFEHRENWE